MEIADNLLFKIYRRYLALSQSDLAVEMGTTQTTVARWESAEAQISAMVISYLKTLVEKKLRDDTQRAFAKLVPELRLCDFEGLLGYLSASLTFDNRGDVYLGLIEIMGYRGHALYVSVENGQLFAIDRSGEARPVNKGFISELRLRGQLQEGAEKVKDDPIVQRERIKRIAQQVVPGCDVVFDTAQPFTWIRFRLDDLGTHAILGSPSGHYHVSEIADWPDEKLARIIKALNPSLSKLGDHHDGD